MRWFWVKILWSLALILGLSGCSGTFEEACIQGLPALENRFEHAALALRAWDPAWSPFEQKGRDLAASTPTVVSKPDNNNQSRMEMAPMDRLSWSNWTLEQLKEVQSFIDLADRDSQVVSLRKEASSLATALVTLHGYFEKGDVPRVKSILGRILEQSRRVKLLACPLK